MPQTVQPSTTRNLAALAGDGRTALAYGTDIRDLLIDEITVEEGDLFVAAVGVGLIDAAADVEELGVWVAIDVAARRAADSIASLRGWHRSEPDLAVLLGEVRHAITFQLTDIDEQD